MKTSFFAAIAGLFLSSMAFANDIKDTKEILIDSNSIQDAGFWSTLEKNPSLNDAQKTALGQLKEQTLASSSKKVSYEKYLQVAGAFVGGCLFMILPLSFLNKRNNKAMISRIQTGLEGVRSTRATEATIASIKNIIESSK